MDVENVKMKSVAENEMKNVFGGCIEPPPGSCTCCPAEKDLIGGIVIIQFPTHIH